MKQNIHLINADVIDGLKSIKKNSIDTIITSPPYYNLRDYQVDGQIGLESTLEEFLERLLEVTKECKRVLKPAGVMFWNMGDSYGGNQGRGAGKGNEHGQMIQQKNTASKCMTMQNERLIMRMIDEQGFILRNRIIWHKSNGMPSSVTDRFSNKYEPVYMLVKNKKYHFDLSAVRVPVKYAEVWSRKGAGKATPYAQNNPRSRWGLTKHEIATQRISGSYSDPLHQKPIHPSGMKNPGDVWTIPTQPHKDVHFAQFPDALVEPMIKAACPAKICPECGHVRERITEYLETVPKNGKRNVGGCSDGFSQGQSTLPTPKKTTGWTSCSCDAGWNPGVVLDPFCGSGTTMVQAKKLGRSAVGIELSGEYCKIIKRNLLFHQQTLGNIKNIFTKL